MAPLGEHHYALTTTWTGNRGTGTSGYRGGAFAEVTLRPRVVVADASMLEAAREAHRTAHEWCFIANSVNFPVTHEATVVAASVSD